MSKKILYGTSWFWIAVHAVAVRTVMTLLVRAEIVEARVGREGGYRLAQPATQITLADVYQATAPQRDKKNESIRVRRVLCHKKSIVLFRSIVKHGTEQNYK